MDPETRSPRPTEEEVRERIEERIRFLTHLIYYVGVTILCLAVDYLASAGFSWSLWIAGVWGVFVYLHFMTAFVVADLRGPFRRWLVRRERERDGGRGKEP